MSNRKKALIWLFVVWGIGLLVKTFLSPKIGTWILYLAGLFLVVWFIEEVIKTLKIDKMCESIDRRFRRIEHPLGLLDDTNEDNIEERLSRPVSYEVYLILIPHWVKIFEEFARRRKHSPEVLKKVFEGKELDFKQRKALWGKDFRFRIFRDETSGMRQIWSDHHKTFVERIIVSGEVFDPSDQLPDLTNLNEKYVIHEVPTGIECTPERLSLEGGLLFKSSTLAQIPFCRILKLLLKLGKYDDWGAEYAIEKFPLELKKEMDEDNVQYDNEPWGHLWEDDDTQVNKGLDKSDNYLNNEELFKKEGVQLYNQDADWHAFHTPYYTVSISLRIFTHTTPKFT